MGQRLTNIFYLVVSSYFLLYSSCLVCLVFIGLEFNVCLQLTNHY